MASIMTDEYHPGMGMPMWAFYLYLWRHRRLERLYEHHQRAIDAWYSRMQMYYGG
jgi:hypothetical protein